MVFEGDFLFVGGGVMFFLFGSIDNLFGIVLFIVNIFIGFGFGVMGNGVVVYLLF